MRGLFYVYWTYIFDYKVPNKGIMQHDKNQQSLGEFQELTEEFLTYAASAELSPNNRNEPQGAAGRRLEKPKLKIVSEADPNNSAEKLFAPHKRQRKNISINSKVIALGDAVFRSNFESGNLENVQKIAPATYEITLNRETNSSRVSAWFFFAVEGLKGECKFIIKGFTKSTSLYSQGMKVCYCEAAEGKWRRGGTKIVYTESYSENEESRATYQLQFSFFFKSTHPNSVQFAYCFPYTYTNLLKFLSLHQPKLPFASLGKTYEGRQIPLVLAGNRASRYAIIISARVHPGETVSSLMAEGLMKELIGSGEYSQHIRDAFMFVIVPMINPDGVVNGNYRFSGSGFDLNRKWKVCSPRMHPEVYLLREKIREISKQKQILMFLDLHGHSRQKNVFFYGCLNKGQQMDDRGPNNRPQQFPYLMSKICPAVRYDFCSYNISKDKEGTARVEMWNQLKGDYIYTLEASFCGSDGSGNFTVADYDKVGAKICQGICLHFWPLIKEMVAKSSAANASLQLAKINEQACKNMTQFFENPSLAKIQYQGNSSDSEPEAGEIPQSQRKNNNSIISIQKFYKASRIMKFSDKAQNEQNPTGTSKNKTNLHQVKLETNFRNKTNESVRPPRIHELQTKKISENKSFSIDITPKTQSHFYMRSQFLNRTINNRLKLNLEQKYTEEEDNMQKVPTSEGFVLGTENEQLSILNRTDYDKNKKKAISFEGAQYRRVRKIAEEHNRRHFSAQNCSEIKEDDTLIKGLVGMNNLIEIERAVNSKKSRQRAPSFFPNSSVSSKNRRGSLQMHFRSQIRATDYTSRRLYVNGMEQQVRCYGKQII